MDRHKLRSTWEEHYQRSKSDLHYPDENLVRLLSSLPETRGRALDFGTGSGRHALLLRDWGYAVTACDLARGNWLELENQGITTRLLGAESFPKDLGTFQLIVAWGVLHYNQRSLAESLFQQIWEALEPGGHFLGSIRRTGDTHLQLQSKTIGLPDLQGSFAELYSLPELESLLQNFGDSQI